MSDEAKLSVERVSLHGLLDGDQKRFVIPHYQRKYSWSKENCETLFEDVLRVAKGHQVTHFFSNVTLSRLDDKDGFHVVDGQQRLTTLSLFLRALVKANVSPNHSEQLVKFLQVGPLLKLSFEDAMDQRTYRHLLKGRFCEPESVSQIMVENFSFFEKRITAEKETFADVPFDGLLGKLLFVKVVLPEAMTPQRVFERMNGVRKPLKQLDLIKNFLLMTAGEVDEKIVYDRWEGGFLPCLRIDWVYQMIANMHAQRGVPDDKAYKTFRKFHEDYGKQYGSIPAFLDKIADWILKYDDIVRSINTLNGNDSMNEFRGRSRLGPLLMKIAIVFSSEDDQLRRNEVIARIVDHQRFFIVSRLQDSKLHKASWDAYLVYKCLTQSGDDYDRDRLYAAIIELFKPNHTTAEARIREWFQKRDENNEPSRNARIVGIWREKERDWGSAEEVVSHFHETFRKGMVALGIKSDPDSSNMSD